MWLCCREQLQPWQSLPGKARRAALNSNMAATYELALLQLPLPCCRACVTGFAGQFGDTAGGCHPQTAGRSGSDSAPSGCSSTEPTCRQPCLRGCSWGLLCRPAGMASRGVSCAAGACVSPRHARWQGPDRTGCAAACSRAPPDSPRELPAPTLQDSCAGRQPDAPTRGSA